MSNKKTFYKQEFKQIGEASIVCEYNSIDASCFIEITSCKNKYRIYFSYEIMEDLYVFNSKLGTSEIKWATSYENAINLVENIMDILGYKILDNNLSVFQ